MALSSSFWEGVAICCWKELWAGWIYYRSCQNLISQYHSFEDSENKKSFHNLHPQISELRTCDIFSAMVLSKWPLLLEDPVPSVRSKDSTRGQHWTLAPCCGATCNIYKENWCLKTNLFGFQNTCLQYMFIYIYTIWYPSHFQNIWLLWNQTAALFGAHSPFFHLTSISMRRTSSRAPPPKLGRVVNCIASGWDTHSDPWDDCYMYQHEWLVLNGWIW